MLLIVATALAGCSAMQGTAAIKGPIAQPVWKVGNEWAYRYETPSGAGNFVWRLDRIETLANEPHYVITADTREIFYRVADLGFTKEILDGKTVRQISPSTWRPVAFPLSVGRSWDMKYLETRPTEQQTENVERRCVAEAEEALTVPAGTFATIRIVCNQARNSAIGTKQATVQLVASLHWPYGLACSGPRGFRACKLYRACGRMNLTGLG